MSDFESLIGGLIVLHGMWIALSLAYAWSEASETKRYNNAHKMHQDLTTYNLETVASSAEYDAYNTKRNAQTAGRIVSGMMFPDAVIDGEIVPEYHALNPAHVPALPVGSQIIPANGWRERSNQAAAARSAAAIEREKNHNAPYKVEFFK